MAGNHSAAVLRNKGICVTINKTVENEDGGWDVERDDKGSPTTEKAWVRFDGNALADLEEAYGDLQRYQVATGTNPFTTARRTLSVVFGWDDLHPRGADGRPEPSGRSCAGCRRAGLAMREGGVSEYNTAIGASLALANGLDPTQVLRLIEQGKKADDERVKARDEALGELLDGAGTSTTTDGSTSGSAPDGASTSSGG